MSAGVTDSPDRSVAEHLRRYLATDGRDGYLEGGVPNLVLTVTGRTSGRRHRTGLFFGTDGERFAATARTAEGAERQRLRDLMTGLAPVFHEYAARSPRTIPVVVLERT